MFGPGQGSSFLHISKTKVIIEYIILSEKRTVGLRLGIMCLRGHVSGEVHMHFRKCIRRFAFR